MKNGIKSRMLSLLFFTALLVQAQAPKWDNPEWENPEIFQINREEPTASLYRYENAKMALENESWENSSFYQSLNGEWDFKYVASVAERPTTFFKRCLSPFWRRKRSHVCVC